MNKLEIELIKRVCKLKKKITSLKHDIETMKLPNFEIDEISINGKIDIDENESNRNEWADETYNIFLENEDLKELILLKDKQIQGLLETNEENESFMQHHKWKAYDFNSDSDSDF